MQKDLVYKAGVLLKIRQIKITSKELIQALVISSIIIGVYYYWFAAADRSNLFLYEHYGWGPFHPITSGRYWMTGLVLSSFITLFYTLFNFSVIRIALVFNKKYVFPSWNYVWLFCQPPIIAGIPLIVMNFNSPVMPAGIAVKCVIASSAGLGLGLYISEIYLRNPKKLFTLIPDGAALVPPLILMLALELPAKGVMKMSYSTAIAIAAGSAAFSFFGLIINSYFFKWKKIIPSKGYEIFLSGLFISYLVLPMMHYLFATPYGRPYITASGNFFPDNNYLKILTWVTAFLIVFLAGKLRTKILK